MRPTVLLEAVHLARPPGKEVNRAGDPIRGLAVMGEPLHQTSRESDQEFCGN